MEPHANSTQGNHDLRLLEETFDRNFPVWKGLYSNSLATVQLIV